jgi:drug/metabolite transporter superfamily protein YnfA
MGWVVGVGLNIIGSLSINLSTNLIKLAHSRNHAATADHGLSPSPWRTPRRWWRHGGNRLWLIAMTIFVAGNLLNFASFAFAAQSLLSALGSVQFVSNVAFARLVNGERLTRWVAAGTLVIAAGCILLVAFGSHDSPTFTAAELQALYGGAGFIAYLSVGAVAVAAAYAIYRLGKRRVGGLRCQTLEGPWARWLPLCYALFSGLPGTLSVLYGKSASILLRTTLAGDSQFGCWYTYFTGVLFVATSSFWMWRFNKVRTTEFLETALVPFFHPLFLPFYSGSAAVSRIHNDAGTTGGMGHVLHAQRGPVFS